MHYQISGGVPSFLERVLHASESMICIECRVLNVWLLALRVFANATPVRKSMEEKERERVSKRVYMCSYIMCVCMYMYTAKLPCTVMYVCLHVCIYVYACMHAYIHVNICMSLHVHMSNTHIPNMHSHTLRQRLLSPRATHLGRGPQGTEEARTKELVAACMHSTHVQSPAYLARASIRLPAGHLRVRRPQVRVGALCLRL